MNLAEAISRPEVHPRTCTVAALLRWGTSRLSGSTTDALDAQLLLGHVLGRERVWVFAHLDECISYEYAECYRDLIDQRASGVPVAYLRGYCEWFGMTLRVNSHVLVPRPETELVLEEALRIAREHCVWSVADIGTGSGAIAIQCARSLPAASVYAVDQSADALQIARWNAGYTGTSHQITWLQGNLLLPLASEPGLLIANLPYLSDAMMQDIGPEVRHEPRLALHGGVTGLELYAELFFQRRARNWSMPVVLEVDPRQADSLKHRLHTQFAQPEVRVLPDYAGLARIVVVGA